MFSPPIATAPTPRWVLWVAVVALLGYSLFLGKNFSSVAGGSDSSGYFNAAKLIASGHLTAPQRDFSGLQVDSATALQPLGFIAEPTRARLVPTYPLGLPAHLALACSLFGWTIGPLLIGVGATLVAMILCHLIARELGLAWPLALAGAVMFGIFPVTIFVAVQPLSDVLAATWALVVMFTALRSRRSLGWAFASGAALAVAVFVRPTNVLLLPALVVILGYGWRPLISAALGGLPGAIALLTINAELYGSPWRMGYLSIFEAFGAEYFWRTTTHFAHWLAVLLPTVVLLLPFAALRLARTRLRELLALALWFFVPVIFYTYYEISHEVWWCLRFILPAVPALILLALYGVSALLPASFKLLSAAGVALIVWSVAASFYWTAHFHTLLSKTYEQAYLEVGNWAHQHLPTNAVVLANSDSGALYYYTTLPILRWDQMSPEEFKRHAAHLAHAARPLHLIIPTSEETSVLTERAPAHWEKIAVVANRSIWRYAGPLP
jgi:hypothetical protein